VLAAAAPILLACAHAAVHPVRAADPRALDVALVSDEAEAALDVIGTHARGASPSTAQWNRLFASAGYVHLKEREAAMGRAFTDSSFARFVLADSVAARAVALRRELDDLERVDASAAASLALAYLPRGTPLRARLYLEIKPITNTFVFRGRDSVPSIFLYVKPGITTTQLTNTLAHELHHIGTDAACGDAPVADSTRATPAERTLLEYLTAFGEGRAMLAAAGGPDVHPHAEDADSIRARWDRDVARAPDDVRELSAFARDVLAGRISSADSVKRRGNSYFGVQGPWYTLGWLMASTVERELGRDALIGTLCRPVAFLEQYNAAAARSDATRHASLPRWPQPLLDSLAHLTRER
jgi:hypothetical protein